MSCLFVSDSTAEEFDSAYPTVLHTIQDAVDCDQLSDQVEVSYSEGVLSISCRGVGTWIINKHSATRQVWLSSPLSGPSKYNFHRQLALWLNERDQTKKLSQLLEEEFKSVFKQSFEFVGKF